MDKKSGVYIRLTDNSFQTPSITQNIRGVVPMLTTKGKLGLNLVNYKNFKDILGYNVAYNPNYVGLSEMLSSVNQLYVWRLNQGATCANMCWSGSHGATKTSYEDVTNIETIKDNGVVVMASDAGDVGNKAVRFSRRVLTTTVQKGLSFTLNNVSNKANLIGISVDGVIQNFFGGVQIYDSANIMRIGVLKPTDDGYDVYRCANGLVDMSEKYGTATISNGTLTVTLTETLNPNSSWVVRYYDYNCEEWNLEYADFDGEVASSIESYEFSLNAESPIHFSKVDFGDLTVVVAEGILDEEYLSEWCVLDNGSNGVNADELSPFDIDVSVLNIPSVNFMFMNGFIENKEVINLLAEKASTRKIHTFVDVPSFPDFATTDEWVSNIFKSEYVAVCARPEKINNLYVYPSVKYCGIYSNMLRDTGTLNFPPAGHTYAEISAMNLDDCDFDYYGDELKTKRINYIVNDGVGTCIWEQRTTYAENTDLSYIAPTFILDSICDNLVTFERGYNFRYHSASDLISQENGLTDILDRFKNQGFLYDYTLDVPTYEDVMESGSREMDIHVELRITKDSEIINIGVVLRA